MTVTVMVDEHAFYEAEYAVCGRCEGSGVDPALELVEPLCAECDGWGEVEVERNGSPARAV